MTKASIAVTGIVVLLLGPTPVPAEEIPITLDQALALASQANPELQATLARAEAQVARAEAIDDMKWPRLGLSVGWSRSNLPASVFASKLNAGQFTAEDFDIGRLNDPSAVSSLNTALTLEVPIDVFGKIGTAATGQRAAGDAASAASRAERQGIRFKVIEAYRMAELARRSLDVTERALAVARAREGDIEARVEAGSALRADLLRARSRRRQREAELAARRGELRVAKAGLARLLGAPPGQGYVPSEGPSPVTSLVGDEDAWTSRALSRHPVLEAARKKAAAAEAASDGQGKSLWPDIGAFGSLYDNRTSWSGGARSWAVGVGVEWSLFDSPRSRRKAAALAEQRAAEHEARAAVDEVRYRVAMAYRNAVTARQRHAAAAGGAEEGREALRVLQERRKAGLATLTDELETETAALAAVLEEIRAAVQVAIADAALRRAAGEI